MTTARIRNLWGEEIDAEIVTEVDVPGVTCVRVPGLGHLFLSALPGAPPAAFLAQGDGPDDPVLRREVHTIDSAPEGVEIGYVAAGIVEPRRRYEIELLPNSSGEDRIVVVIEP